MKNFVCLFAAVALAGCGGVQVPGELRCGAGTRIQGNECVPFEAALRCGAGTRLADSQCVPESGLTCGAGTVLKGSACVAQGDAACGAGTLLLEGECRVDLAATCGTDTTSGSGQCVTKLNCGSGTSRSGDACVASNATGCGAGTVEQNGKCEIDAATVCGAGTTLRNGKCEAGGSLNTSLGALVSDPKAKVGFYAGSGTYSTRFMVTGLSQGSADSWADISASPVADGVALHVSHYLSYRPTTGSNEVDVITNDTNASGTCLNTVRPDMSGSSDQNFHVSFVEWKGGLPTVKACAKAGSVRVEKVLAGPQCANGAGCAKVTINAALSDGTVMEDKIFYAPIR